MTGGGDTGPERRPRGDTGPPGSSAAAGAGVAAPPTSAEGFPGCFCCGFLSAWPLLLRRLTSPSSLSVLGSFHMIFPCFPSAKRRDTLTTCVLFATSIETLRPVLGVTLPHPTTFFLNVVYYWLKSTCFFINCLNLACQFFS